MLFLNKSPRQTQSPFLRPYKSLNTKSVKPSQTQSNHAYYWSDDSLSPRPSMVPLPAPARQIEAEQSHRNPRRAPAQTDALVNRISYIVNMQSNPVQPSQTINRTPMPCLITRSLCPTNQGNPTPIQRHQIPKRKSGQIALKNAPFCTLVPDLAVQFHANCSADAGKALAILRGHARRPKSNL